MKSTPDFDFQNFKVHFCKNQACRFFSEDLSFMNFSECFDYHKDDDRRRKALYNDGAFNYSPKYYYDSNDNNLNFCKNQYEFYYHPMNYKSKKCEREKCDLSYCPFYHRNEERDEYENQRKRYKNAKVQTLFDDVNSLCKQITETLKIREPVKAAEIPVIVAPISSEKNLPEINIKKNESYSSNVVNFYY